MLKNIYAIFDTQISAMFLHCLNVYLTRVLDHVRKLHGSIGLTHILFLYICTRPMQRNTHCPTHVHKYVRPAHTSYTTRTHAYYMHTYI